MPSPGEQLGRARWKLGPARGTDTSIRGVGPAGKVTRAHSGFSFTEGPAAGRQGAPKPPRRPFLRDKAFNAPNDLVIDRAGGVYFTDPWFGGTMTQDGEAVYYVVPGGEVTRLIDEQPRPNGVRLSPDEKTLYVLLSGRPALMAYPVEKPGVLGKGKELGTLSGSGDEMTVDTRGNLYLSQPARHSIVVMSPEGKTLGEIAFPEAPASAGFGGKDMRTLYVTAQTSLYTVKMEAAGHRFAAQGL